jgi:hypothetical protein
MSVVGKSSAKRPRRLVLAAVTGLMWIAAGGGTVIVATTPVKAGVTMNYSAGK